MPALRQRQDNRGVKGTVPMQAAGKSTVQVRQLALQQPAPRQAALQPSLQPEPELRQTVQEASRALALLDAPRLEELAFSCRRLTSDLASMASDERAKFARQAEEASDSMAVFARVLEATRANLAVMHRLRDLREGRLEYGAPQRSLTEGGHGDD